MNILFRILRNIVIKYSLNAGYIDTSSRYIGSHENLRDTVAEFIHDAFSFILLHISVKRISRVAAILKARRNLIDALFRVAEDETQRDGIDIDEPAEELRLRLFSDFDIILVRQIGSQFFAGDLDVNRIFLVRFRQLHDLRRHRRRKQQHLLLLRNFLKNRIDILSKTHIQHLIRLIEHQHLQLFKSQRSSAHMIHHSARRSDDDLRLLF